MINLLQFYFLTHSIMFSLDNYSDKKSFYGKAHVIKDGDMLKLQSYNTIVAEFNQKTKKLVLNGWYSMTTARHINGFLRFLGLPTMSKKEIEAAVK